MRIVVTCRDAGLPGLERRLRRAAARLAGAAGSGHLVEARLDLLARPPAREELARLAAAARGRLLVTCRPEGSGSPRGAERVELLLAAARDGAVALDLEAEGLALAREGRPEGRTRASVVAGPPRGAGALAAELGLPGCLVLLSLHLSGRGASGARGEPAGSQPAELALQAAALAREGPGVVKLAAPAGSTGESLAWMRAVRAATGEVPAAPVPLGEAGRGLRLLAGRGLSALCYLAEEEPVAEGQPRLDEALERFAVDRVGEKTPLFAVLGWPLAASWSPALHSELFRRRGLEGLLVALPVRDAAEAWSVLADLSVSGAAVTMPHKPALLAGCVRLSPRAAAAGAVNTLTRGARGWAGEAFDGPAARAALESQASLAGRRVALLGAGGAARCLLPELRAAGAELRVFARRLEAAEALVASLGVTAGPLAELADFRADVVVNATPEAPGAPEARSLAFDLATTPHRTAFLREAERRGLATLDGLALLARQAAAQQRLWRPAPAAEPSVSDAAVEHLLRQLVEEEGTRAG